MTHRSAQSLPVVAATITDVMRVTEVTITDVSQKAWDVSPVLLSVNAFPTRQTRRAEARRVDLLTNSGTCGKKQVPLFLGFWGFHL